MSGDQALALAGLLLLGIGLLATFSRKLEEWAARFAAWRSTWQARPTVKRPTYRPHSVTSSPLVGYASDRPVAPLVAHPVQQPRQPIATTSNEGNTQLHQAAELSDDVRDIIQFQDRVETVVSLYKSGQVTNLAKTIESVFKCSRTSKEESTYQKAKRAIDPLIAKPVAPTPIAGRPTSAVFQSDMEEVV
jgi:hypothetical protein